jgi:hypothetical protein
MLCCHYQNYCTWRKLHLMRYAVGILMVIDGYPLIFFFKETLRIAPGSTAFTAAFLAMGFGDDGSVSLHAVNYTG